MMASYIDEEETHPGHADRLIKKIWSECVQVPHDAAIGTRLGDMIEWCVLNVGERRPNHPIHEAYEGWMDYFDGLWAVDYLMIDNLRGESRGHHSFWFARGKDKTLFSLIWL